MVKLIALATAILISVSVPAIACENGHWIKNNIDRGRFIELENGSVWKINPIDRVTTSIWLPTTEITICDNMLVNTQDHEAVSATQLQ